MMRGPRSFGPACFALLGLFIAGRLALPFLPSENWSESGFHCASDYAFLPLERPHTCLAARAFGEGARVANRLDFVSYRSEKFTVDSRGFRNLPAAGIQPKVILQGSSFSLGLSLNDEDTFAAQLNRRLGPVVYNASKVLNPMLSAGPLIETARVTGAREGWVLLEILNRGGYAYDNGGPQTSRLRRLVTLPPALQSFQRRLKDPFALSRMTAMINMRIDNDVLLPNPERWRFAEEVLRNGRHMLFYFDDEAFFFRSPAAQTTVDSVARLRTDLRKAGLRLAVVLVPNGFTVYWPLMKDTTRGDPGAEYFSELDAGLRGIGIPVFNCLPLLRDAAQRELAAGRLVYWPDDAHWNPAGVAAAADQAAPWLEQLLADQSPR